MTLTSLLVMSVIAPRPISFLPSVQAWTFHQFTAIEALDKISQAGAKYVELFPGQKLKSGSEVSVGPWMSASDTAELQSELSKRGLQPVAFGVTDIDSNYDKAKPLFVWAKSLGIRVINTESTGAIDTAEKLAKEFDICVGYHNHPSDPKNPNYKVWNPEYIYNLVKDRDSRVGACADTGHWIRSGIKPIDALKTLKGRVVSSHLKDLNEFSRGGHDVPYGTGVSEIAQILAHYDKIGLKGSVSVEYEYNWKTNVNEVAQCIGFVRGLYGK